MVDTSLQKMPAGSRISRFSLMYSDGHLEKITSFMALVFVVAKSFVLTKVMCAHMYATTKIQYQWSCI